MLRIPTTLLLAASPSLPLGPTMPALRSASPVMQLRNGVGSLEDAGRTSRRRRLDRLDSMERFDMDRLADIEADRWVPDRAFMLEDHDRDIEFSRRERDMDLDSEMWDRQMEMDRYEFEIARERDEWLLRERDMDRERDMADRERRLEWRLRERDMDAMRMRERDMDMMRLREHDMDMMHGPWEREMQMDRWNAFDTPLRGMPLDIRDHDRFVKKWNSKSADERRSLSGIDNLRYGGSVRPMRLLPGMRRGENAEVFRDRKR